MSQRDFLFLTAGALAAATVSVLTIWLTDPPVCPTPRVQTRLVVAGDHVTTINKGDLQ